MSSTVALSVFVLYVCLGHGGEFWHNATPRLPIKVIKHGMLQLLITPWAILRTVGCQTSKTAKLT